MRASIGVIVVRDERGESATGTARDVDSPIYLGGLTAHGDPIEYLGPGRGVTAWAKKHGLKYGIHQLELDLDSKSVLSWKTLD